MNLPELENRLKHHAEITKAVINTPFHIEREEITMTKPKYRIKRIVILTAALICLIGTTVFAAFQLLSAKEVANSLGDSRLAQYFNKQGSLSEAITDGDYKATLLGLISGENLSQFNTSSWEIAPERTYAVVAVEKADGTEMSFDDEILVTPLISGLAPWQYNIFTMNGGYSADIINGVLYRIIECDTIEYFADRDVYMAIVSESFLNNKPYTFDEATGAIEPRADYEGTNILIKLELDPTKADPQKAQEAIASIKQNDADITADTTAADDAENEEDVEEFIITQDMVDKALNRTE